MKLIHFPDEEPDFCELPRDFERTLDGCTFCGSSEHERKACDLKWEAYRP